MTRPDGPGTACAHRDFAAVVDVNRLRSVPGGPVDWWSADIRVQCADCDEPFRWVGVPCGVSPSRPMGSADKTELRAPLRPLSATPGGAR